MSINEEDLKMYYQINAESWKFLKKYLVNLPMTMADWNTCADDLRHYCDNLPAKYQDYACKLMFKQLELIEVKSNYEGRMNND